MYKVALAPQRLKLPPKKFCYRRDATQILSTLTLNTYISEILRQAFFGILILLIGKNWEQLGTIGNGNLSPKRENFPIFPKSIH
jgi:hypothetical protein